MNKKVVPNPDQKGWEADGTTPDGTPVYKWESGGGSGGLWEQNGDDIYYNDGNVGMGKRLRIGTGSADSRITINNEGAEQTNDSNFIRGVSGSLQYNAASLVHKWEIGGDEKMRIDSSGNVGIGTDNPEYALHVNAGVNAAARIETTTDYSLLSFDNAGTSGSPPSVGSFKDNFRIATSGYERMTIDASGNTTFTGAVTSQGDSSILSSANNTAVNLNIRTNLSYNDSSQASITLGPAVGPVANGRTFRWRIASGGNELGHDLKFYKTEAPSNNESVGMYLTGSANLTVNGNIYKDGGTPVASTVDLITALTTLRNATKDETTLEGMRDALADAIGGLIENLEHEIATMPAEDSE